MSVTHYRRSNGELELIQTMHPAKLIKSIAALERNLTPDREEELEAMKAQAATNKVVYRAQLVADLAATSNPEEQAKIGEKLAKLDAEA